MGGINGQFEAKNIIMTEGCINIIDATPIEAARSGSSNGVDGKSRGDSEAGWHVKNDIRGRKKSTYGFSIHTGVDEDGFIYRQRVRPSNVHDSQECDTLILGDESALCADAAYSSKETRDTLEMQKGVSDFADRNKVKLGRFISNDKKKCS